MWLAAWHREGGSGIVLKCFTSFPKGRSPEPCLAIVNSDTQLKEQQWNKIKLWHIRVLILVRTHLFFPKVFFLWQGLNNCETHSLSLSQWKCHAYLMGHFWNNNFDIISSSFFSFWKCYAHREKAFHFVEDFVFLHVTKLIQADHHFSPSPQLQSPSSALGRLVPNTVIHLTLWISLWKSWFQLAGLLDCQTNITVPVYHLAALELIFWPLHSLSYLSKFLEPKWWQSTIY